MSSSSAISGSRTRVDSSRTSIAIRRLPVEGKEGTGRRAERGYSPGASVGARNTHLVMDLARGSAHGDGGGAPELNHDRQGNPLGSQIPPTRSGISYTDKGCKSMELLNYGSAASPRTPDLVI